MSSQQIDNSGVFKSQPVEPAPELLIEAGDALSKSLLFALRRDYLNEEVFKQNLMRMSEADLQPSDIAFLKIEQVGKPVHEDMTEYFTAIQTTLAACHDPRYALVFIVSSDGLLNHIYIGIAAREGGAQPSIFAEQVGQFLCSNWPGTRVKMVKEYQDIARNVHVPLSTFRYARSLTGIPSIKQSESSQKHPQSLDRFMRGLRGKPYVYMVVAEPMQESEVSDIISSCHTLSEQVHAFIKATINRTRGRGTTQSVSQSEGTSSSTSQSTAQTESETSSKSKGVLGSNLDASSGAGKVLKGAGLAAISSLLVATGGPFLLSGMLGMFGQLLPSTSKSTVVGTSETESETTGSTSSTTQSEGISSSESLSFGREYLNRHAEACDKLLSQTVERFEIARSQGCWNVGVYLLSNQTEVAAQAQAQLKALVSGQKTAYEPVRFHDLESVWDGQVQIALDAFLQPPLRLADPNGDHFIRHPIGPAFEGLSTPMNTEELSLLANLPLREMPGIPIQATAYFSLNPPVMPGVPSTLHLGDQLEGGEEVPGLHYDVDLDSLTRHIFITGITGSGKSNTCRRIISELMMRQKNFLVIEPAKSEYVQLAMAYNRAGTFDRKIAVFMPGRRDWAGEPLDNLYLNPFDIVQIPRATTQVMPHLDRLKSIFNASFPMYEILPIILEEALVDLYDSQGWLEAELPPHGVGRPTLEHLYNRITGVVREKGYEDRITANITAALRTRIGSLLRGWKGDMFNCSVSTPWTELFDQPVVINLQYLGDDADKCFTMALLLNFMYEYRQAQYELAGYPESSELHHLAIFEEAHRILRASAGNSGAGNSQAKMGEMFADILAEIRAYGQGMAIIDQVPSKLVPDALKNTNLKIVHRLVASDDRDAMAGALALTEDQAKVIARLKVGQAIVAGIQDDMASWVKVAYTPLPK